MMLMRMGQCSEKSSVSHTDEYFSIMVSSPILILSDQLYSKLDVDTYFQYWILWMIFWKN